MAKINRLTTKLQVRKSVVTGPRKVLQVGRNEQCPCGSGKKYKDCHASEGDAYLQRLAKEHEKLRIKEAKQRLKEEGVPFYKRWIAKV